MARSRGDGGSAVIRRAEGDAASQLPARSKPGGSVKHNLREPFIHLSKCWLGHYPLDVRLHLHRSASTATNRGACARSGQGRARAVRPLIRFWCSWRAVGLIGLAASTGLSGCDATTFPRGRGESSIGSDWPFRPATLRVHPLTRFTIAPPGTDGRPSLEVFILLLDDDGLETRGVGTLNLTLSQNGPGAPAPLTWAVNLSDPSVNRRHFDVITRTYRVPLRVDWTPPVHATFSFGAELRTPGARLLADRVTLPPMPVEP